MRSEFLKMLSLWLCYFGWHGETKNVDGLYFNCQRCHRCWPVR